MAAARELSQETALESAGLRRIGYLRPDSALLMTEAVVFLAELQQDAQTRFAAGTDEGIVSGVFLPRREVMKLVRASETRDGITLGALALLLARPVDRRIAHGTVSDLPRRSPGRRPRRSHEPPQVSTQSQGRTAR